MLLLSWACVFLLAAKWGSRKGQTMFLYWRNCSGGEEQKLSQGRKSIYFVQDVLLFVGLIPLPCCQVSLNDYLLIEAHLGHFEIISCFPQVFFSPLYPVYFLLPHRAPHLLTFLLVVYYVHCLLVFKLYEDGCH